MSALNSIVIGAVVVGAASLIASRSSYVNSKNDDQRTDRQTKIERDKKTIAQQARDLAKLREERDKLRHEEVRWWLEHIGNSLRIIDDKLIPVRDACTENAPAVCPTGPEGPWLSGRELEEVEQMKRQVVSLAEV